MIRNILIFGFPFYLALLEAVLRKALNVDSFVFLGPTLAAVGIGFAIPLTETKDMGANLKKSFRQYLKTKGLIVYSKRDVRFFCVLCIMLILMVSGWYCSLYFSLVSPTRVLCNIPIHFGLGILIYVDGVLLYVLKGKI